MPAIATRAPDNPDFARVVAVAGLRAAAPWSFDVAPDPGEAERIARLLDARSVRKMRFRGSLRRDGDDWILEGALGATVVQTCVVTLEPVTTRLDLPVRRRFVPGAEAAASPDVLPDEDDEIEPLPERIDLGLVAVEALALALPAYPRKEGAALPETGEPDAEGKPTSRPFASLAALRDRLDRKP